MAEFYRIVRVQPNGTERIIRDVPFTSVTEEQQVRASAFADGSAASLNGQHIRLYSSDENGVVTPDDLIWDSKVNL
jgi:hypothetical protein